MLARILASRSSLRSQNYIQLHLSLAVCVVLECSACLWMLFLVSNAGTYSGFTELASLAKLNLEILNFWIWPGILKSWILEFLNLVSRILKSWIFESGFKILNPWIFESWFKNLEILNFWIWIQKYGILNFWIPTEILKFLNILEFLKQHSKSWNLEFLIQDFKIFESRFKNFKIFKIGIQKFKISRILNPGSRIQNFQDSSWNLESRKFKISRFLNPDSRIQENSKNQDAKNP